MVSAILDPADLPSGRRERTEAAQKRAQEIDEAVERGGGRGRERSRGGGARGRREQLSAISRQLSEGFAHV